MIRYVVSAAAVLALVGCATGTDGPVPIGGDAYMIGGLGGVVEYSSSSVKARFFKEASDFCATKGMGMQPLNSTGQDAAYAQYASAEVQFRCVPNTRAAASSAATNSLSAEKWAAAFNTFLETEAARPTGIDYRQDTTKRQLFETKIRALLDDSKNSQKSMAWFLIEANKQVREDSGLAP